MEQERIDAVYEELETADFTIHDYNTPDEISNAIVHCRGKISGVSNLAIEVQRAIAKVRRSYKSKKKERLINYNQLMRENEEVKKGKSGLDRQAIAESLLSELDTEVSDFECTLSDLKSLYEAISLRISNLNKTNSDIRLAWNIMNSSVPQIHGAFKEPAPISVTEEDLEGFDFSTDIEKNRQEEPKEEPKKVKPKEEPKKVKPKEEPKEEEPKEEPKKVKPKEEPKEEEPNSNVEDDFEFGEKLDQSLEAEDIGKPVVIDSLVESTEEALEKTTEDAVSEDTDIDDFLNGW